MSGIQSIVKSPDHPEQSYTDLIKSKLASKPTEGIVINPKDIHPKLFPFQARIVRWALSIGRAALFEDCGLGKSLQQLEWASFVLEHTGKPVLIYAPLTIGHQTKREAAKIGLEVKLVSNGAEITEPAIYITNYERHHLFDALELGGLVLDESSILKNSSGKIRNAMIEQAQSVPFRLCCTATPAPNDITEISSHAEFLGIKTRTEMLAHWFVHDADGWRLKGHATRDFYRWLATWSVFLRDPSDIGESADGYVLPQLQVRAVPVETLAVPEGFLFQTAELKGVGDRAAVRKSTIHDRVEAAARLIEAESDRAWVCWTGLNDESDALARRLKHLGELVVQVEGNTSEEDKVDRLERFVDGRAKILITKPRVSGFGLNFQHCARQAFIGIGDSWEQYYQCLRRSYRFGQPEPVIAYIVTTTLETAIVENVMKKEAEAKKMGDFIIENIGDLERKALGGDGEVSIPPGVIRTASGPDWTLHNGDCVEVMAAKLADESIDLSVYSPPFATLYTYSDNPRDMGNCVNYDQFYEQFGYAVRQLFRITKAGRLTCVHVAQTTTTLASDGVIGLNDFRGAVIDAYKRAGWVHHREVCIDKCPQAQAIRTHSKALLFVQMKKDRSWSGPALADYILVFRKPGEPAVPIQGGLSNEEWIQWARPIWYGIRESDTLNAPEARSDKDERHICPLQLGVIQRCIKLWSNPRETVFSPFSGIGSEGYQSLLEDRVFVGAELKPEYFEVALKNLRRAELQRGQQDLFSGMEVG